MRFVPVFHRGRVADLAMVDEEDFDRVAVFRWRLHSHGYARLEVRGRTVLLHRLIMGLEHGDRREVDHKNRVKLDCRRENLRVVPLGVNLQNMGSRGTSRFRGVAPYRRGHWQAYAQVNGRRRFLGEFRDEVLAALAAHAARCEHMPFALPDPELVKLGLV